MNESQLNAAQIFGLLGVCCIATATAAGLLFKRINRSNDDLWSQPHVPNSVFPE